MKAERKRFDWEEVRGRLARVQAAKDGAFDPAPGRVAEIFRERAARFAAPAADPAKAAGKISVLVFRVAGERYGMELDGMVEAVANPRCAPVPGGPAELAGVLQVRGNVRPVWELARLLHLEQQPEDGQRAVLLVRTQGREIGLQVDAIETVLEFAPEELRPPDAGFRHLRWMTADLLPVLNVEKLLEEGAS
jgi:purine-binding chemotaxis protein CheW